MTLEQALMEAMEKVHTGYIAPGDDELRTYIAEVRDKATGGYDPATVTANSLDEAAEKFARLYGADAYFGLQEYHDGDPVGMLF